MQRHCRKPASGFTLIELSIVLVIIGLIVGGVLTGQELIKSAGTRAIITQIEKYNIATNTFVLKYGGFPGDLNASDAAQLNFVARAGTGGRGDGNGLIEAYCYACGTPNSDQSLQGGETMLFWSDLSAAGLIEGAFTKASDDPATYGGMGGFVSSALLMRYFPPLKSGNGFVYAYSGECCGNGTLRNNNWFGISAILNMGNDGQMHGTDGGLSVAQAYAMDAKLDDGLPKSGRIKAFYPWAQKNTGGIQYSPNGASVTATTCFDTTSLQYSVTQDGGAGMNCGLSMRMQ